MHLAIASGKGGTGKTTVATNLAWVAAERLGSVAYVDCDVEEPNGALFLKPAIDASEPVNVPVPVVDPDRCTQCGLCGRICRFSAIAPVGGRVLVFPELCHGCGGCRRVCPTGAIHEVPRRTGWVERGRAGALGFVQGVLDVGQSKSPPIIRAARAATPVAELVVIDAPPGTSCPVVESMRGADYLVLVTEPTPFGLHDLGLAIEMARALNVSFGVVLNRVGPGTDQVEECFANEGIHILAAIAEDRRVAESSSRGDLIVEALPEQRLVFSRLLEELLSGRGERRPLIRRGS